MFGFRKKNRRKSVDVFKVEEKLYVIIHSESKHGLCFQVDVDAEVDVSASNDELGALLLNGLNKYEFDVVPPDDIGKASYVARLCKKMSFSKVTDFMSVAELVTLTSRDGTMFVSPRKKNSTKKYDFGGYENEFEVGGGEGEIGASIKSAFEFLSTNY